VHLVHDQRPRHGDQVAAGHVDADRDPDRPCLGVAPAALGGAMTAAQARAG